MENSNPNVRGPERVEVNGMSFELRPRWRDQDISEINKYRLPPDKQMERRVQRISKNYHKASSEYRVYLESLRSDERAFWSLCRSVSPARSRPKESQRPGASIKRRSSGSTVHTGRGEDSRGPEGGLEAQRGVAGRDRGVPSSGGRVVRSLPPALGCEHAGGGPEGAQDTGSVGIDLYLTNVALQSCVESYSRRLYNICRMIDVDSGSDSEGLADGAYFSELDYGIPIRGFAASPTELAKTRVRISDGSARAKEGALVSLPGTQPQVSGETISETASKWSIRLRSGPGPGNPPSLEAGGSPRSPSPRKMSRATRSRLLLKERISSMDISELGSGQADLRSRGDARTAPVASVITTQNANISEHPFSSLFNL
ncbi:hypothetical protein OJ253_3491 [Cryptosporidium canis]|uniref:Uncharacterized protein n=1 Tax=Cryptosporidium canis TaxID=195482 RepID=A0A9D5DFX0_9CRYT|nr:hypothetical protein OJ253_3491 [Cryptosporidium canis]